MTHAEYIAANGREPHDEKYWGPAGVNISRWNAPGKTECARGCSYHVSGVDHGGPGQVRKISQGRKARGFASGESGKP